MGEGPRLGQRQTVSMQRQDGMAAFARSRPWPLRSAAPQGRWPACGQDAPGLQCLAGFDGRFVRLSSAWADLLGWPLVQLQGQPLAGLIHADDRAACLAQIARLARVGGTVQFEGRWRCRDGSYRWLQWLAAGRPADGRFQAVVHDVTEARALRQQVLQATDTERARLARELHDGLCQQLAGIAALSAALARRLAASGQPGSAGAVAEVGDLLNQAVVYARDLAHGLSPSALGGSGLADGLAALAGQVQAMFGVVCRFSPPPACPGLDPETATHLYRIVQQAVHNALVHGRARHIDIALVVAAGQGRLCVRDNGAGLPAPDLIAQGQGLRNMAYRAQWLGGSLDVHSAPAAGTEVVCHFPLPPGPSR